MLQVILEILIGLLIISSTIFTFIFYKNVNREFTNIYCRLFELEKKVKKDE